MMRQDTSGWCVWGLVGLGEKLGDRRSNDEVSLTYYHIDIECSMRVCVCVLAFVMTAYQSAPQLPKPLPSQPPQGSSITVWMGTIGDLGGRSVLSGQLSVSGAD